MANKPGEARQSAACQPPGQWLSWRQPESQGCEQGRARDAAPALEGLWVTWAAACRVPWVLAGRVSSLKGAQGCGGLCWVIATSCVWSVGGDARLWLVWIRPLHSPEGAAPRPAGPKVPAALGHESWETAKDIPHPCVSLLIADMPSLCQHSSVWAGSWFQAACPSVSPSVSPCAGLKAGSRQRAPRCHPRCHPAWG